jgi:GT2 family glycosyltransferase
MISRRDAAAAPDASPELSVIITTYNARQTVAVCLDSLLRQKDSRRFEIILVDSSTDGTAEYVRQRYPQVRLLSFPERLYCGEARNQAMAVVRAPVIAFLDADCFVNEDWAGNVLRAHESPHLLAGGIIDNGSRKSLVGWAYYFCEYSLWLPRAKPEEVPEMAGCCLSFKREAFERYGPFLCGTYCSDTAFHWAMQRDGHKVLFTPAIRVFHTADSSVREFLAHVAVHRRFFIRVARSEGRLASWQRWPLAFLAPLYVLALLMLTARRVLGCPVYLPQFLLALPLVFAGFCARTWGELSGLLENEANRARSAASQTRAL